MNLLCRLGFHGFSLQRDRIPSFDPAGGWVEVVSIRCPRCGLTDAINRYSLPLSASYQKEAHRG